MMITLAYPTRVQVFESCWQVRVGSMGTSFNVSNICIHVHLKHAAIEKLLDVEQHRLFLIQTLF